MKYFLIIVSFLLLISCSKEEIEKPVVEIVIPNDEAPASIPNFKQRNKTVSPDALGGGDGSDANPWTLNEAMEFAQAGDTIGIKAGIYIGQNDATSTQSRYSPAFTPKNAGTKDSPIVFVAENQASKISAEYTEIRSGATETGTGWPAFGCYQKDYIYWVGIYTNENVNDNKGASDSAPCTIWSSKGCAVIGCVISGEDVNYIDNHSAIRLEDATDLKISDNKLSGFNQNRLNSVNQAGIITYDLQFSTIEHNDIFDCGAAIQLKGYEHYGIDIRYNTFHDNVFSTIRAHGFTEGPQNERSRIYQNVFFNNAQEFEFTSSGTMRTLAVEALDIFNNSIYTENGTVGFSFLWITDNIEPHTNNLFNNVIYVKGKRAYFYQESPNNSAENFVAYIQPDYNCYYGSTSFGDGTSTSNWDQINFANWQSLTQKDQNSMVSDPLFTNVTYNGLKLSPDSPCLNTGIDKGMLLGNNTENAINMGAYISKDQSELFGVR
ncbi:NosD domain-containing protein [Aquimarina aquimarini]|uniref:NosD domain-containing protein n=1 Tax=Aquimarina aquimarini TaxID=1191734 RepID=UPI000D55886B|nr:NosD domain-containing protein [Aquimarina aquimarini]